MSIIAPNDFKAENAIAQVGSVVGGVSNTLQSFIDKYEPKFLKMLLGATLYNEFKVGLTQDPVDPKWTALRDEMDLKAMIVDYVYYWYMRNMNTSTAGMGEVIGKTDNASYTASGDKMCRAWNEMCEMVRFFDLSTDVYPSFIRRHWRMYARWYYGCDVPEIFYPINKANI